MEHNLSLLITSNFRGNSLNYQVNLFEALRIRRTAERRAFLWLKKILEQEIGR